MHSFLLVGFLGAATAASAAPQSPASLEGQVTDPLGAAVANAVVSLTPQGGGAALRTTSDENGRYRFDSVAPGAYRVRVESTGFQGTERTIELGPGGATADLTLSLPGFAEQLVVTATRSEEALLDVPASVTREEMKQLYDDGFYAPADEFRGQPSIFFRRGEGDNDSFLFINIRGVTGNHGNDTFLALVDGIPFVGPDEEVIMSDIPYRAVDNIELVRGPVSALYGRGGITGAINYRTLVPAGDAVKVRASVGSDTYLDGGATLSRSSDNGRHQFLLDVDGQYVEGWRESNTIKAGTLFFKGVSQLSDRTALTYWASYFDRYFDNGSVIPTLEDATLVDVLGGREGFIGSRDLSLDRNMIWTAARLDHQISDGLSWQTTGHYRHIDSAALFDFYDHFGFDPSRNVMTVNGFESEKDTDAAFFETQFVWRKGPFRSLFGANYERTTLDEQDFWTGQYGFTFECGFTFFAIELDYTTGEVLNRDHPCFFDRLLRVSAESVNQFASGFAQVEVDLGDRVTATLGGRYDRFTRDADITSGTPLVAWPNVDDTLDHFSPKASLLVNVAEGQNAYFSFGEGFNSNFGPVWQWDPSQYVRDVKPTTLRNYEVGAKGTVASGRFQYGAALFFIEQNDRLIYLSNPDAETDFTAPATLVTTGQRYETRGIEVVTRVNPDPMTSLFANYSFVDAEWKELVVETFGGPLDLSGTTPTGVPDHIFSMGVDRRFGPEWSARLWWEYYADYFVTLSNGVKTGQYDLLNLGVTYRPAAWGIESVNFSVTNLLDEEYYFFFGYDQNAATNATPGVPLQARVSVDFRF